MVQALTICSVLILSKLSSSYAPIVVNAKGLIII